MLELCKFPSQKCSFCADLDYPLVTTTKTIEHGRPRICWLCAEYAVSMLNQHDDEQKRLVDEYGPRP